MTFTPKNFRHLPEDFRLTIRTAKDLTLILVKPSGEASYARTVAGKDEIVTQFTPDDLLLLAWTGTYYTDIFHLTKTDIDAFYR